MLQGDHQLNLLRIQMSSVSPLFMTVLSVDVAMISHSLQSGK